MDNPRVQWLVIVAQGLQDLQDAEDLRREAGLRGDEFTYAAWALAIVFSLGVAVVWAVALRGRRKRQSDEP